MGSGEVELPTREPRGSQRRPDLAYEDGVGRLVAAVEMALPAAGDREARLAAGLRAGLDFLAASPALAHLLLVESLAAARPARLEHERALAQLAEALRPAPTDGVAPLPEETARLLAGGLVSHLSGRVLAGEAERLAESHGLLLGYLLAPSCSTASYSADEQRTAAHG